MSSSIAQQLVAMGFAPETASAAAGNNRNIDQALTFIQAGGEGYNTNVADSGAPEPSTTAEAAATSSIPAVAQGFKCDECGALLANDQAVVDHANKTKHSKFSQSTEETKADEEAKIKQVFDQILAGQKQKEQVKKEKPSDLESRALQTAREEQRDREIKEYAEQRRRQKAADDVHRKKILEQIKLDQEERKERAAAATAVSKVETSVVKKGVEEGYTMLQIRLPDGKTVKQMFKAHEQLVMVRAWVETNHQLSAEFQLITPFPRKEFTDDEMGTTLRELNLVPSANIVVVDRTPPPTTSEFKVPYPPQSDQIKDSELD